MKRITQFSGILIAVSFLSLGCSEQQHPTTAQEKKSFLGGPMPPAFAQKLKDDSKAFDNMREKMEKQAADKAAKAQAAPGPTGN